MNKLKLNFAIIIVIVVGATFVGCEKQNELIGSENEAEENTVMENNTESLDIQYVFTIDNNNVSEVEFTNKKEDLLILISSEVDKSTKKDIVIYDAFTTEEKYIAFGEKTISN